jgi:RND family efflux transporter MFP subunit
MKRLIYTLLFLSPVLLAVVVAVGCGRNHAAPPASPAEEAPTVQVVRPQYGDMKYGVEQPGRLEAFEETALYARIAGYVKKLPPHVDIGYRIKEGETLLELDVPELVAEVKQKEATVVQATAEVENARTAREAARAEFDRSDAALKHAEAGKIRAEAAYVRWKAEDDRNQHLVSRGSLDERTAEQSRDQLRSAEASLAETKAAIDLAAAAKKESAARLDQAGTAIKVAEARLQVAASDRDRSAALLGYGAIKAPYDGVITQRLVNAGTYVQAPSGPTAPPLLVVARTDVIRVFVDVPEAEAGQVREGGAAVVRVQALRDQEFQGVVARSSFTLDNRTRTLRTEIDLKNADGRLRPGQYANVRLGVERTATWTVPAGAVLVRDDQPLLVLVVDGKAVWTPVKLGGRRDGRVEVVARRIKAATSEEPARWEAIRGDEEVVAENPAALTDGQAVRR